MSPGPHVSEQVPHSPHSPQATSIGQLVSSQVRVCSSSPSHSAPPSAASTSLPRVRTSEPSPQVSLQGPKPLHWPQTQSTGQGSPLHSTSFSSGASQGAPLCACGVSIVRCSLSVPSPQDTEQALTGAKSVSTQSTGQGFSAQATCFSRSAGQAAPSCWASTEISRFIVK